MIKDNDEITEGEVNNILLELTMSGLINAKTKDGETGHTLTGNGLGAAEKILGGRDVGVVASGLTKTLAKCGDAIGNLPDTSTPHLWLLMVQIARIWKEYHVLPWEEWVKIM